MKENTLVSHLSSIHPDARIGMDVKIDPFVTIYGDVEIGDGTWIGSNAVIHDGARIGRNCRIFPGAVISTVPQDLKFRGEYTVVEIGDNVTIREFVTVHRGTVDRHKTVVGNNVLLMAYAHVAHDCVIGNNVIIANSVQMAGHVIVDDYTIIGGMTAVHQFVRFGKHVIISGGSLVGKDVPPYVKAARDPLSYRGINSIGLKRRGYSQEKINELHDIYRLIFLSGYNITRALEEVDMVCPPSPERDEIVQFFRSSSRGFIRGYSFPE